MARLWCIQKVFPDLSGLVPQKGYRGFDKEGGGDPWGEFIGRSIAGSIGGSIVGSTEDGIGSSMGGSIGGSLGIVNFWG